jgi:hypothetical protein
VGAEFSREFGLIRSTPNSGNFKSHVPRVLDAEMPEIAD